MALTINKCRVCYCEICEPILDLGPQYYTGVFPKSLEEKVPEGPLELIKCVECHLVQLHHSFELSEIFGGSYGYRSGLNSSMVKHLEDIKDYALSLIKIEKIDTIIDIGSNDGTLLNHFGSICDRIGIDPTTLKFSRYYDTDIEVIPYLFPCAVKSLPKAKLITSISMFYDLPEPVTFAKAIHDQLIQNGVWIFEQSYLPSMLKNNSFDTICHEHLEYYSVTTIKTILDKARLKIINVQENTTNGGSILITAARADSSYREAPLKTILKDEEPLKDIAIYTEFAKRSQAKISEIKETVRVLKQSESKIAGYGASSKGNVLLQACGLTSKDIDFIAEVNDDKFGAYTPGSKIPISSSEKIAEEKPDYLLVLPWHFKKFFVEKEKQYLASGGKLIFPLPEMEIISINGIVNR